MILSEEDYLAHYGILRRSGRYPWGSGGSQSARNRTFLQVVEEHRRVDGWSEKQIADFYGLSTTQLRAAKSIAKNEQKQGNIAKAQKLKDKGWSNTAIAKEMGTNESTVRMWLAPGEKDKVDRLTSTADMLKQQVAEKTYLDVGKGVEHHLGISGTMLSNAVAVLREEGYEVHPLQVPQLGTGKYTNYKILCPPGTTKKDVWNNRDKIEQIATKTIDFGRSWFGIYPPLSISPRRVGVNYKEDGGDQADGVIYVRRGVKDVSLGKANYAQVRIQVGDGHYLKGMAMYKDDLPAGVDLVFNTNKSKAEAPHKLDVMKPLKRKDDGEVDLDNPFGAQIKLGGQILTTDSKGNTKPSSVMNIVNEEGDWHKWSKNLSSQMLSKQSPTLARTQLNKTYEARLKEYERISSLTNPTVKKKLLESFGDETDSAAVTLKAAALNTRQASHVILPITSMPENQVYAPNFRSGERVVLIRYPHAGTFEIPELTVNNNHREAKKILGDAKDAIGIHPKVAERLSGADFDGDSVVVIPNNTNKIKSTPALEKLKDFDPRSSYPGYPGMKKMDARTKGIQMGDVSNLITDMTIKKASTEDIARAVKHSMVVIDAEKHGLDWRRSEAENGIRELKKRYQGASTAGASTLISRAGSEQRVPHRIDRRAVNGGPIDPATGKRVYEETGRGRPGKDGESIPLMTKVKKLALTDDAHTLSSGTPMERVYADHSNSMKALANRARKEAVSTPPSVYSPSAAKAYATEVAALNSKLVISQMNSSRERQAQILANSIVRQKKDAYPDMDKDSEKKIKAQALNEARVRTGAKKDKVVITPQEWEAIQAGAISNSKLKAILENADLDVVKSLATPKPERLMSTTKTQLAQRLLASGYTRAEVADRLGVSLSTLDLATNG